MGEEVTDAELDAIEARTDAECLCGETCAACNAQWESVPALVAEVRRLREALEEMADNFYTGQDCREIARKALGREQS